MKRVDLIRHIERNGCEFLREGDRHTVYVNRALTQVFGSPASPRDQRLPLSKDLR
jgi:hypothetical protein